MKQPLTASETEYRSVDHSAPFYVKWAAKIMCWWLVRDGSTSFQCCGRKNWDVGDDSADIQVPVEQIMHWIRRSTGEDITEADILDRYFPAKYKERIRKSG